MKTSRRSFIAGAAAIAATAATAPAAEATTIAGPVGKRVLILGGGVGGLTAAHELIERGFAVTIVEPKAWGGKARSITVPGTGTGGRQDLPGEHGFRFFPGFYKNIPDTMRRIPVAGNPNGAFDHLVNASQELFTLPDEGQLWLIPEAKGDSKPADAFEEAVRSIVTTIGIGAKVPANEIEYFLRKLLVFLTSSDARRVGEWEYVPWTVFTNSDNFSPAYQTVFGTGLTKDLVAAKGHKASTRTVGLMAEAFVYALLSAQNPLIRAQSGYGAADRLLDLPTSEAWIDPWIAHLRSHGVRFLHGYRASRITMSAGKVAGVSLQKTAVGTGDPVAGGHSTYLQADWYVCAMPAEQMSRLVNAAMATADPALGRIKKLEVDWMNGIQFFLNRKPALPVHGHVAFLDAPWALTSIDQGLFWRYPISSRYGDGRVHDIYSVDISDFFTPGIVYGKTAQECTPKEIAHEVWAQMKRALNRPDKPVLTDDMVVRWFLDPAIHYPQGYGRPSANREPLLINTAGSLDARPNAASTISNLFLASDYVRTNVDLATMEGANEAGRLAANAILTRSGSTATPASMGTLWQPAALNPLRNTDAVLYKSGLPNALDIVPGALGKALPALPAI